MRQLAYALILMGSLFTQVQAKHNANGHSAPTLALHGSAAALAATLYQEADLARYGLQLDVLQYALQGYLKLQSQGALSVDKDILSVVDFSKPSTEKRLWIIDIGQRKLLFHTYVAHGRNSGLVYASQFSNVPESYQSSLGFYVTGSTYQGKHGLSLLLEGQERNINHQARSRAIVIHGADYVSESHIKQVGRLGRSHGCPAIPNELKDDIINTIKNRTCLFIYHPDQAYFKNSPLLKS